MKCNVCHNEFGNGEYCQNCKADKVVGLGNYTGYNAPHIQHNLSHQSPRQQTTQFVDSNMTICYKCANPIPANVDFCPACGLKLTTTCPKCGNKFSSRYAFCSGCGVNVEEFIAEQKRKEATEQALRIAEQKRRDAAILAEQQRQAELQRIAEAQKQEELRKKTIAMQQPEFVDALAYIKKMLGKAEKKLRNQKRLLVAYSILLVPGMIIGIHLGDEIELPDSIEPWIYFLLAVGAIYIPIGIFIWLWIKYFTRIKLRQIIKIEKYLSIESITNSPVKELVKCTLQLIQDKDVSIYINNNEKLNKVVLEAYFKLSESSK